MVGNNVSHSNHKSKRRFLPALRNIRLQSESLGQTFRLRISNAALRTVDFRGGPILGSLGVDRRGDHKGERGKGRQSRLHPFLSVTAAPGKNTPMKANP